MSTTTTTTAAFTTALSTGDMTTVARTLINQANAAVRAGNYYADFAAAAFAAGGIAALSEGDTAKAPTPKAVAAIHSTVARLLEVVAYTDDNKAGFWKMLDRALRRVAGAAGLSVKIKTKDNGGKFQLVNLELPVKAAPAPKADEEAERVGKAVNAAFADLGIDPNNPPVNPENVSTQADILKMINQYLAKATPATVAKVAAKVAKLQAIEAAKPVVDTAKPKADKPAKVASPDEQAADLQAKRKAATAARKAEEAAQRQQRKAS